ncbi:polypeptide deformylase [Cladophialophora psammophila CBS 110553]|uniref:Peptide deformylase n=1 Tax=Cladophialophora psammophila CBS 110553 TaxID=1182543 RepID=W9WFX1_9EURO|nr:polypeptide deformylase [Cladophialophora psammophila CBS 110553]EXJ67012.1 polypeptide deformylase [Cladophialophora psammophila CBS 110553]
MSHPNVKAGGKILPIVRWGTPTLHRELRPATCFDTKDLDALIADMFATMYAADGAGLGANQVGVDLKMFVYDLTDSKGARSWGAVCNPVIESSSPRRVIDGDRQYAAAAGMMLQADSGGQPHAQQTQTMTEGCLSYPGVSASVSRRRSITINGLDQRGKALKIHASGLLGHVLQHEVDHLNGIVYGDRVPPAVRRNMDREYRALEGKRSYPDDWPATQSNHKWLI